MKRHAYLRNRTSLRVKLKRETEGWSVVVDGEIKHARLERALAEHFAAKERHSLATDIVKGRTTVRRAVRMLK